MTDAHQKRKNKKKLDRFYHDAMKAKGETV